MSTENVRYEAHAKQQEVHDSSARFRTVVAGRQSGKTRVGVAEICNWATSAPTRWPDAEHPVFWWVTASYMTTAKARQDIADFLPKSILAKPPTNLEFHLRNGSQIIIRSADALGSLASAQLHGLVGDEFCQWKPEVWSQYLQPMLATTLGPALMLSKPWGRNWGYDYYTRGFRGEAGYASFHWRSNESPYFAQEEFVRLENEMPEREFRQEILAEFVEGGGEIFRHVDTAIRQEPGKRDTWTIMGLDLARTHDFTVIWVMNGRGEYLEVQRLPHVDWALQRPTIIEAYKRNGCTKVVLDASGMHVGADPIRDQLMQAGLNVDPIVLGGLNKRAIVSDLMVRFDNGAISLPDRRDVVEEFKSYEETVTASGNPKYGAPSGRYDDCVMAAGLAVYGLRGVAMGPVSAAPKTELEEIFEKEIRDSNPNSWGDGRGEWD